MQKVQIGEKVQGRRTASLVVPIGLLGGALLAASFLLGSRWGGESASHEARPGNRRLNAPSVGRAARASQDTGAAMALSKYSHPSHRSVIEVDSSDTISDDLRALEDEVPEEAPSEEERRMRADLMFESENLDRGWAYTSEESVRGALSDMDGQAVVKDMSCRSSLCRVVLEFATEPEGQSFVSHFLRTAGWDGEAVITHETLESGRIAARIYLARRGVPLSDI